MPRLSIATCVLLISRRVLGVPCATGLPWVHDGVDIDLFRAVPDGRNAVNGLRPLVVGQVSTVGFTLQYKDVGSWAGTVTNDWADLSWGQLTEYHGARVHVNIMSANGDDFYHVHPEYTTFVVSDELTELGVDVTFLQPGEHLVTTTWVVETSSLNLCTIENIKHAHGVSNNALLYPLLMASWTVTVLEATASGGGVDDDDDGGKLLPSQVLHTTPLTTLSCGKPAAQAADGSGHLVYQHSYELHESVTCCCSFDAAAHVGTHAAQCGGRCAAGASCARVTTTATSVAPVVGVPSTYVSVVGGTTLYPAGRCMAVQLDVTDPETGAPHTLSPYLGAAAHVYVAPVDVGDAALQHGQSGGLCWAIAGHHGLIRLYLKAWGCPPLS